MNRNRRRARLRALPCDPVRFVQHPSDVREQRVLVLASSGAISAVDPTIESPPAAIADLARSNNDRGHDPLE